jgi:hypothetical protein
MRLLGMISCFAFEDTLSVGWFFPCTCYWSTRHCSPGVSHLDAVVGLLEGSIGPLSTKFEVLSQTPAHHVRSLLHRVMAKLFRVLPE